MKRFFLMGLLMLTFNVKASNPQLNETLVRIINQINAIMPLLDEANEEIEPDTRIRLHVDSFEGADGQKHPGIRDDLINIRSALIEYINNPVIEPRIVKPLALDFIGK